MIRPSTCLYLFVFIFLVYGSTKSAFAEQDFQIVKSGDYQIIVADKLASTFDGRDILGTHLFWYNYQKDLISPETHESYSSVISFFQKTKGVIRYGGSANELPWKTCRGQLTVRPIVKPVPWYGPMQCQFGIEEYLSIIQSTGGNKAWVFANIAGVDGNLFSTRELSNEASQAASDFRVIASHLDRYWELGNELERGRYNWSPEMIAQRASQAGKEIVARDKDARLILPVIEFDSPNQPIRKIFNERLLRAMTQSVKGIALHLYYDGAPGGPPIPTQLKTVIESAATFRSITGHAGEVWITEHGRWPEGDGSIPDWKLRWYKTNDLDGVLGTADFLIGLAQIDEVAGAMLHGLRAGPWNIFEKSDGDPHLTGVGRLLILFSDSASGHRLQTRSVSLNRSNYKGGYDMRATAFIDHNQQTVSLWVVNRSPIPIFTLVSIPPHGVPAKFLKGSSLTCPVSDGKCTGNQFKVSPVNIGQVKDTQDGQKVMLPARSVITLQFKYIQ